MKQWVYLNSVCVWSPAAADVDDSRWLTKLCCGFSARLCSSLKNLSSTPSGQTKQTHLPKQSSQLWESKRVCVGVCVSVRRLTLTLPPFLPYLDWATKEEQDVPVIHTLHFNWVFCHPRLPIIITALVRMNSPADLPALQYNCLCVFVLLCDRELCSEAHRLSLD